MKKWIASLQGTGPAPSTDELRAAIRELLAPGVPDVQKAALLALLPPNALKAETMQLFVDTVMETSVLVPMSNVADIVGSGGDGQNTWNISTPASIIAAGAGIRVAKHGNRSATSNSGSADLLEQLGAYLDVTPSVVGQIVDAAHFGFLHAARLHPVLRNVAKVRSDLGTKTVFNFLGPLMNPANPTHLVVGVCDKAVAEVIAQCLAQRPGLKALVVTSEDGMDKISPVGKTHSWLVEAGKAPQYRLLTPEDFGLPAGRSDCHLGGGSPQHNAVALLRVLRGAPGADPLLTDFVLVQVAALAVVAGKAASYTDGMQVMRQAIASGAAMKALDEYVRLSTRLSKESMRDILQTIVRRRQVDVAYAKAIVSEAELKAMPHFASPVVDLAAALRQSATPITVMAEIKRASPSEGDINVALDLPAMVQKYVTGGAAALSILTEPVWFKGSLEDLRAARTAAEAAGAARPAILRKEFVVDKYQILEAKAYGADTVLLIAAIEYAMKENGESLASLVAFSRSLGMEPLVEVVTEADIDAALQCGAKVIGINNRDLTTFKLDLGRTETLMRYVEFTHPDKVDSAVWVSLSGVNDNADIRIIHKASPKVKTVLVGTSLMRAADPVALLQRFTSGSISAADVAKMTAAPAARPLVKICGLKTVEQVISALRDGVDFVGLMFYPESHRYVADPALARRMVDMVHSLRTPGHPGWGNLPQAVGVFVRESAEKINALAKEVGFDVVQLYGYKAGDIDISQLKKADGSPLPVIWTCSVASRADLDTIAYPPGIVALCIDRKVGTAVGGTGQAFDWTILKGFTAPVPLWLAGGIDETNVAQAAELPGITVLDVSSGVETDKVKDFWKIRVVVRLAKRKLPSYFGQFGGQFVPEILMPALIDLEKQYLRVFHNVDFWRDVRWYWANYAGRPTLLYKATKQTEELRKTCAPGMGAQIWYKREDLLHTGAHKINNALGQALMAKWLGKRRMIAETGAGQHGVATATVCALFGLECTVYMGALDTVRQKLNVLRMEALGAQVVAVEAGQKTLNDAVNDALRDWATTSHNSHYMIGSAVGPHPFPTMVRDFQSIISQECRKQCIDQIGRLPDQVFACTGGGSNAIGMFDAFVADAGVQIFGVEAGGDGKDMNSATLSKGSVGIVHGAKSYLLQDEATGQVKATHSVSAGLDYPGVGPEHSYLKSTGRVQYVNIADNVALEAFQHLARTEGILAALESSHAVAATMDACRNSPRDAHIVCCMSGRGDKDMNTIEQWLRGEGGHGH